MGILLGYACLLCFFLLIAKIFTKKFHYEKADHVLMKLHNFLCVVLIIFCLLHFIFVLPVLRTRVIFLFISGFLAILFMALIILLCHKQRKHFSKWLRWHKILSGLMLFCVVLHILIYFIDFQDYQTRINHIRLQKIDIIDKADGQYIGEYDAGYIYAKVQVIISNGTIQNIILLEHRNERGQAAEKVLSAIINTQTFPVDAISGATNSSMVIQKAVQNALEGEL